MSTSLEEMYELEPHVRVARARAGVIMLIVSDVLSVIAILAAGGYLRTLDVERQFGGTDHPPAFLTGLLLAAVLVVSGLCYFLWERRARHGESGQRVFFFVALLLLIVAMVGQIWVARTLGYTNPFHAYASMILLLSWYSAFHTLLAAIVGILVLGRMMRGRLAEHPYIVEVVGYWWYYTVIAAVLMWIFMYLIA
jgi:heme/copper-type cytochrome/quinol oxidase subunit 3